MNDEPDENRAADSPSDNDKKRRRNKKAKTSSGKGLAAIMLFLGLLIGTLAGGLVGLFTPRTGVLEGLPGTTEPSPVPTPVPTTVTRTVEVDRTPDDCLDALDDLTAYLDDLSDSRDALMRADLARVSGDEQTADSGFAEVDRQLRSLILAGNAQSLRSSIEDCRAQADESDVAEMQETPSEEPGATPTLDAEGTTADESPEPEDTPATESPETPSPEVTVPLATPQPSPDEAESD